MTSTDLAIELRKHFPTRWDMVHGYHLPTDDPRQPYYHPSCASGVGTVGFDERGIVCTNVYNPCTIAAYALYCYGRLYHGDSSAREPMLRHAECLLRLQREDGAFPYEFIWPEYGVRPGWTSCIAQGKAAAALWRAFIVTQEKRYKEAARRALLPLMRDVNQGGTLYRRDGDAFFEEVSANTTHILNGHLYAAFAVWEACRYGIAPAGLADIHEASVQTLLKWLPLYDAGEWSYYQLATRGNGERHYATIAYHQTHIAQLHIYSAMTGREEFAEMSQQWRRGLARWIVRARVWANSAGWLSKAAVRQISRRRQAWVPFVPEPQRGT